LITLDLKKVSKKYFFTTSKTIIAPKNRDEFFKQLEQKISQYSSEK